MNIVKSILDELSGDTLEQLSSQFNANPKSTANLLSAGVPAVLSALGNMSASDEGARKLSSTLGGLDVNSLLNLGNMFGRNANETVEQGGGMLSSLLGDGLLGNIASAIGRFASLDSALTRKILAFITPFLLGKIASAWKHQGGTPQALKGLFSGAQADIADALPQGFSLANIPGMSSIDSAAQMVDRTARAGAANVSRAASQTAHQAKYAAKEVASSPMSWLLPLALLALIAFGLWWFVGRNWGRDVADAASKAGKNAGETITALKPPIPEVNLDSAKRSLTSAISSATKSFGDIRDAASATAALPKLTEWSASLDGIHRMFDKLPEAGQAALGKLVGDQFASLQQQVTRILAIPDLSPAARTAFQGFTSKLAGLNVAQVSSDASDIIANLKSTLEGITDAASAKDAVAKLQNISTEIDSLQSVQAQMPASGQSMLAKLFSAARGTLQQMISKVVTTLGADASSVQPVLDEIIDKLGKLAGTTA